MTRALSVCLSVLAVLGAPVALALETEKLQIGSVSGLKRPDGFVVEDLRTEAMRTASREQTYRRPFEPFAMGYRGPEAKYRRNFGDAETNVSPVDLLVDRLIARYGDTLQGKALIVREFSIVAEETVNRPGFVAPPGSVPPGTSVGAAVGTAVVGTLVGNALLNTFRGPGRSARVVVKIAAELDGKPIAGSDYGGVASESMRDRLPKIVEAAIEYAFYTFEKSAESPEPQVAPVPPSPEEMARQPDISSKSVSQQDSPAADAAESK